MKAVELAFLNLLRAALQQEKPADPALAPEDWEELLRLSEAHKLLPLILDTACALPSCRAALYGSRAKAQPKPAGESGSAADGERPDAARGKGLFAPHGAARGGDAPAWRDRAFEQVSRQAIQENEFLDLILALQARGLEPLVLKGPICRALYPKPLLRPSLDDDLLIPADRGAAFHEALLDFGLLPDEPGKDPAADDDLEYRKPDSPLFVELNKSLFDPASAAFRPFNAPFAGAEARAVWATIQDVRLKTLAPTDHLLFLILHAFKHFLYSGFGVRIAADVCLFTWKYGGQIDFAAVLAACEACRAERFAAALYRIGEKYLDLPIPELFARPEVDEAALLADMLASGIHGNDIDRLHSANLTLDAVSGRAEGRERSGGLARMLFPSAKRLAGRYPYLQRRPWLLPAAWVSRFGSYVKHRRRYGGAAPTEALRIGAERVKLLERYGVIDA